MGRYLQDRQGRSELQERIAADLRAKAAARAKEEYGASGDTYIDAPDGVEDSAYIKGTKKTTTLAGAWLVIFFLSVGVFILFIVQMTR